jgi:hypothetical protein
MPRSFRSRGWTLALVWFGMAVAFSSNAARSESLVQFLITTATTGAATMPGSVTTVSGLTSTSMAATGGATTTGNSTSPAGTWNRTYVATQATGTGSLAAGNWITWTTTAASGYEFSFNGLSGLPINRTSTGPTQAALFYSTDGGSSFQQTGGNFTTSTTLASAAATFSTTMASTPIKLLSGTTGIIWRLVGFGSGASRMGIGTADAVDFTMLGTVDLTPALSLTWAAAGGTGTWDTSPANLSWTNDSGGAAASFTDGDNVTFGGSGGVVTVSGSVAAATMTVTNASGTYQFTGGGISTSGAATKSGSGTLVLGSAGTYAQGWQVTGGTLVPDVANAVGSAALTIDGATLAVTNPAVTSLTNAVAVGSNGATLDTSSDVTVSGGVSGASGNRVVKTGAGGLTLSGQFGTQTTAPLELDIASGTTTLSGGQKNIGGTNDWNGAVVLNGGVVMIHGGTTGGAGSVTNTNAGSTVASRLNAGPVAFTSNLVLDQLLTGSSPNGNNRLTFSGTISGTSGLSLIGNGAKQIDGVGTYAGPTTLTAGSLRINGTISNASTLTVTAASLSGNGVVDSVADLGSGSTLSLVDGVGASALTFQRGLSMNPVSTTQWFLLANTDAGAAAGTPSGFSQARVTGGDLIIPNGASVNLNFSYVVSATETSTVAWSDPFWNASHSWTMADRSGSGTSTLSNFTIANASFTDSTGATLDTSTRGSFSVTNDGQNVFLVFNAVPEPTVPLAAAGVGSLLISLLSRRRR